MNLKLSVVLALIIAGAFPAASILAMQGGKEIIVPRALSSPEIRPSTTS